MLRALVLAVGWSVAFACPANGSAAELGTRKGPQRGVARLQRPAETHLEPNGNLEDDGQRQFLDALGNRVVRELDRNGNPVRVTSFERSAEATIVHSW